MFKICAHQFRQAFFSPRLYLALILGCTIQIISVFPLLDFSKAMGEPLGIFEAFIYFNTDTYTATCAFLGAVLMVSDIPFSSQNETYTLLRVSRKTWVAGKVLYLLGIMLCKTMLLHGVPFAYGTYLPRGIPQGLVHAARRADIDIQRTAQSVFGKRFPHGAAAAHTGHGAGRVFVLCPFVFQISLWIKFNIEFVHFLFLS